MKNTRKICYLGILTSLYAVMSAFLKFYVGVGHIQIDLGYIAFAFAVCEFGVTGALVGVVGCSLESILFTTYGFSISWAVANAIIGVGCGFVFSKTKIFWIRTLAILVFTAIGMVLSKTMIECALYSIPILVKLPKSIAAFCADSAVMIFGLWIYGGVKNVIKIGQKEGNKVDN